MIKPVKTVIVGCGFISDAYLSTMRKKFKILDVVGCCDVDPAKAEARARQYGIKALTMAEIQADESIEIVVNLTTPTAHYPVIKQLLEMGKHVYTEKVLAVELAHAAELVSLADAKGLYLGAAPDTFLGSAIQTTRQIVDSGLIGDVTSCYCALTRDSDLLTRVYPFTAKAGGGIGFDVGIYYITALLSLLGPVTEVGGVVRTAKPIRPHYAVDKFGETYPVDNENLMAGTLQFARGTVGNVLFDSTSISVIPEKPSLVLSGTLGVVAMADPNLFGGDVRVVLKGNAEPFVMQPSHAYDQECRGLGVAEMAWSLRQGRKNRANKEMAYHALEVLHGLVKSSATKSNQPIRSTFDQMPPLPRGYVGFGHFDFIEEAGLAFE